MDYDTILKHLQTLLEIPLNQSDENFERITPLMFAYAENRIYRELDFLATTTATTGTMTANNREMNLPSSVLILRQMNVLVPTGYPWQKFFIRGVLERLSLEAIDAFGNEGSLTPGIPEQAFLLTRGVPRQYAILSRETTVPQQYVIRLWPTPDKAYGAEFTGVIRPEPLSPSNPENLLSTLYPDLLCAACMVFASGYQRDFGAQADDPSKAMSWEGQYTALRNGAMLEAARQRGEAAGWSSTPPAPLAQPRAP